MEDIKVSDINDADRQRGDYGDIKSLESSIRQFGLIQPVVLQRREEGTVVLVAGGRRLAALRGLRYTTLRHGKEYIWRDEDLSTPRGTIRLQAVELEENLKRKDLHWSEEIKAKAKLLEIMQSIHGASRGFGVGKSNTNDGFGIIKLSEMLGEDKSVTSRDIDLAKFVSRHPTLAQLPTKADARRKLGVAVNVAAMQKTAKASSVIPAKSSGTSGAGVTVGEGATPSRSGELDGTVAEAPSLIPPPPQTDSRWILYDGDFQDNILCVPSGSVDLVLTDLPYNIGLGDSTAAHSAGLGSFDDSGIDMARLVADVAKESFRTLRDNRFGVFFYGAAYHQLLFDALSNAGFTVDTYPFIWIRDRSAPPDGFARYSKTYDPALVCSKGTPRFIRPNLPNHVAIPSVRGPERLHAAQKPVALMQKFIEDMTTEGCVVLDMMAGAGSTGVAALQTKRKVILFEKEAPNCVLIRSRLGVL